MTNSKKLFFSFIIIAVSASKAAITSELNKNADYKNFGIILSGPSGVGKTTVITELQKSHPELVVSISATTRMPRKGEINGQSYYFIDRIKFQELARKDEFMEYTENYGNYYGSPKRNYIEAMENGKDIIFTLSTEGMRKALKNKKMDFVTIFLNATSEEVIIDRLKKRNTDTEAQISKRTANIKQETATAQQYDYVIYNDDIKHVVNNIEAIYLAEKWKRRHVCK